MDPRLRLKSFEISQNLCQKTQFSSVTDNIGTIGYIDVGDVYFETECVGDNFEILVPNLIHYENHPLKKSPT